MTQDRDEPSYARSEESWSQAAARGQDRKKETSGWLVTAVWCRGEDRRRGGEGGELDQADNYPNCRAAVAGPGCLGGHRDHICSRIIPRPAAGNRWRGHRTMAPGKVNIPA